MNDVRYILLIPGTFPKICEPGCCTLKRQWSPLGWLGTSINSSFISLFHCGAHTVEVRGLVSTMGMFLPAAYLTPLGQMPSLFSWHITPTRTSECYIVPGSLYLVVWFVPNRYVWYVKYVYIRGGVRNVQNVENLRPDLSGRKWHIHGPIKFLGKSWEQD